MPGEPWSFPVRYVAIDLCATFRAAVRTALPHAQIVVGCFHIVQVRREVLCFREGWKDPPPGCRSSSVKLTAV